MAGWDLKRRIRLGEPWDEFHVVVLADVDMGTWLDFQEAWVKADAVPSAGNIGALIDCFDRFIVEHDITRNGEPIELRIRSLTPGLVGALVAAIKEGQEGGGDPADPFEHRAPSPAPSSPTSPSRRASRSTASRATRASRTRTS